MASSDGRNQNPQSNLHHQDLSKLDVTKLTALSREVISRQATINIGTIGHVAHGKSTVVKAISGVQTVRFKNELERNITIKLERLSETIVRLYHDRADEREDIAFYDKVFRSTKKCMSVEPEETGPPPSKKQKRNSKPTEFIIEKILDFQFSSGKELFHVKWKGYPDSENTWEPKENLDNCPIVRTEFIANLEVKYCNKIQKLKKEISFDGLLNEENLCKHLKDFGETHITTLKETLILNLVSMITLQEDEEEHAAELVQQTRTALQLYVVARKRCRQLMRIKKWEEHMNQVDKSGKLVVENDADLAGPPENFTYINECIPGAGVVIPDDPPIGCECTSCNCRSKTCCGMQVGLFAYTTKKRLRVAPGTPIYECNKACKCGSECSNRVVQGRRTAKLCVFRTLNGCGWGVRAEEPIKQGRFLCQYVGEIITFEEAEKRGREYDTNGLTYLFDLDFNSSDNPYTIDAGYLGNVSHFINHSCDPNLGVWAVWADCLDPNLPMLALFATRDIEMGEEICFDYLQKAADVDGEGPSSNVSTSSEVQRAEGAEASAPAGAGAVDRAGAGAVTGEGAAVGAQSPDVSKSRFEIQQRSMKAHRNMTECRCGAVNCRRYLF